MIYFFAIVDDKGFVFMTGTGTKGCAKAYREKVIESMESKIELKIKYFYTLEDRTTFILTRREKLIKGGKKDELHICML